MYTTGDILNILKAKKAELERKYPISEMGLLASYARGDYDEHSDIDILVDFDDRIGIAFSSLAHELEDALYIEISSIVA